MKSETQVRKELNLLVDDLKFWRTKFDKETDADKRRLLGTTIAGVEGQKEALEWALEVHKEF
jgi:hypothetical protein